MSETKIDANQTDSTNPTSPGNPETSNDNAKSRKEFSVEIFRLIRNAQKQHGLRHGDFQRYRGRL